MILFLLALTAIQQTTQSVVELGSREIDPVVAPFVHRYVECKEAYVRERAVQPGSTAALRALYEAAVPACAGVRRTEYRRAERALARNRVDARERRQMVEDEFRTGDQVRNQYGEAVRREIREQQPAVAPAKPDSGPAPLRSDMALGHVTIPDEIAPAIIPYVRCVMASRGVPLRSSRDGPAEAPTAAAGADCTPVRQEAARRAEAMLVRQHRGGSSEQRTALIERTLAGVDNFAGASPVPPPNEGKPDAPNR